MGINRLYIALLWRTLAALVIVTFAVVAVIAALFQVGIQVPSKELESSVSYVKLKPSIGYLGFAFVVLISEFAFPTSIIRALGGRRLSLSPFAWHKYSVELAFLLALLSVANALVAGWFSTEAWIQYKTFGALAILLAGIYLLAFRATRHAQSGL